MNLLYTRVDVRLRELARHGQLHGERWLIGGSFAALRWCALLTSITASDEAGSRATERLAEQFSAMIYDNKRSPEQSRHDLLAMMTQLKAIAAPR
jgi:hypothetical protein